MHQTPCWKIIPIDTDTSQSIYSQPSLLLATGSTSPRDKESHRSYIDSNMESTLEGPMHYECKKNNILSGSKDIRS